MPNPFKDAADKNRKMRTASEKIEPKPNPFATKEDLVVIHDALNHVIKTTQELTGAKEVPTLNAGNIQVAGVERVGDLRDVSGKPTQDQVLAYNATKGTWEPADQSGGGLENVVEDLTPQLGGDLDLNGKNLDFPTTANISDCLDEDNMASNSATALATQQSIKAYVDSQVQADTNSIKKFHYDAADLQALETNFAPLEKITGSTVNVFARAFDDTTEEFVNGKLQVPSDVQSGSTITFRAYVYAKTAAASRNIGLTFSHIALNDSDDFDVAYTAEASGDKAIDATQDNVTEVTWTETLANLGWAADDLVLWKLNRDTDATNDLVGDMYLLSFAVEIPRA